jgi:hypothetical protein
MLLKRHGSMSSIVYRARCFSIYSPLACPIFIDNHKLANPLDHGSYNPTHAEIKAFIASHG